MVYSEHKTFNVLMLPWLAHGHISPFLELAKKLTKRNFHIFLCSTPVNLKSVKLGLSEKYSQSIELVELHLPTDEFPELPPHYHTTNGLPPHLMATLKAAFDKASSSFSDILKTLSPDLLIYDFLQPWAPALATSINIPVVVFSTMGAATLSLIYHLFNNPGAQIPFPSMDFPDYEIQMFNYQLSFLANGMTDGERMHQCCTRSSDIILMKTSRELEAKYIDYFTDVMGKKVVPVGPLVQEPVDRQGDKETSVMGWLNNKERSSVVYVSFGSEYFLSRGEIEEVAHGLELSEVGFVWVIRFPVGETKKVEDVLPQGFVRRVGDKGMIVEDWAPQAKILKHSSVGGFVSHCGWSSIWEGIKFGVPIIAMPMQLEQPVNARLVEEVGVGVEVARNGGGGLEREEIAKVIRDVVVEKVGEGVRRKAMEVREEMEKKEEEEIEGVMEELTRICPRRDIIYK